MYAIRSYYDTLHGNYGNDISYGGDGDDRIYGENGDDTLYGGNGNDYLNGGSDDDLLDGGVGDDYMNGSDGNDRYLFGIGSGHDRIHDESFSTSDIDTVQFGEGIAVADLKLSKEGEYLCRNNFV